jgi:hypothetical protein
MFDFKVEYRKGADVQHVDALSHAGTIIDIIIDDKWKSEEICKARR